VKKFTITFEIPKDLPLNAEDKKKTPQELAQEVIQNVILTAGASQRGLREEDRRLYYKICDKLDEANKEKSESVDFEDQEFGFIKKCFRETPLNPNKLLRVIEDLIGAVAKE